MKGKLSELHSTKPKYSLGITTMMAPMSLYIVLVSLRVNADIFDDSFVARLWENSIDRFHREQTEKGQKLQER